MTATITPSRRAAIESIASYLIDIVDAFLVIYLEMLIAPFLKWHKQFYGVLNKIIRREIDRRGPLPTFLSANVVTYSRTCLVVPTVLLLASKYRVLPALCILLNDFGDFFNGVVARYWASQQRQGTTVGGETLSDSSDEGFHVISVGSAKSIASWTVTQRSKNYGGFIDAVMDKAFLIPIWIICMSTVGPAGGFSIVALQYSVFWTLVFIEVASASIRFRAFFTAGGAAPPILKNLNFAGDNTNNNNNNDNSAIAATSVGKAKQTFQMVGTSLYVLPFFRWIGLVLLIAAIPLAYESVRCKLTKRVIYVDGTCDKLDHKVLKFWMQAKELGSKLVVGIAAADDSYSSRNNMIFNACAVSAVDMVIVETPPILDLKFLSRFDIDYIVCSAVGRQNYLGILSDEIFENKKCIAIGDDGIAYPVTSRASLKAD